MALMSSRSWSEWLARYAESHQNPTNRFCHTIGIPLVAASVALAPSLLFVPQLWPVALCLFVIGWIFQLVGHHCEGKPPEFTKDWRFLFVGLRWWLAKVRGRL
jgi:uncharacterized membrane protein YGL010W